MQYTQTLALITQWYNRLHSTILAVELGLVKEEMGGTRRQLKPALLELTWSRDDLLDYIQTTRDLVQVTHTHTSLYLSSRSPLLTIQDVSSRVQSSKDNVEGFQSLFLLFMPLSLLSSSMYPSHLHPSLLPSSIYPSLLIHLSLSSLRPSLLPSSLSPHLPSI